MISKVDIASNPVNSFQTFSTLPVELTSTILSLLSWREIFKNCQVCKQFNAVLNASLEKFCNRVVQINNVSSNEIEQQHARLSHQIGRTVDQLFPNLKKVSVRFQNNIESMPFGCRQGFLESLPLLSQLRSLHLWQLPGLTDDVLISLLQKNDQLKSLHIPHCDVVSDETLIQLPALCPELESVHFSRNLFPFTQIGLVPFFKGCSKLRSFELNLGALFVSDIQYLKAAFTSLHAEQVQLLMLESLTIGPGVDDELISLLLSVCPSLKVLSFPDTMMSENGIKSIAANLGSQLTSLNLASGREVITDSALQELAEKCDALQSLNLMRSKLGITNSNLVHFTHSKLRSLAVSGKFLASGIEKLASSCLLLEEIDIDMLDDTTVTDKELENLAKVVGHRLTTINLGGCTMLTNDSLFSLSQHCTKLKQVYISRINVTPAGIKALISSIRDSLQIFFWDSCPNISTDDIKEIHSWLIANCPRLQASIPSAAKKSTPVLPRFNVGIFVASSNP